MFKVLKRLIENKYYDNKEDIQLKVDVFFGYNRINEVDYATLCELIEVNYPTIEEPIEEVIEETPVEEIGE